MNMNIIWHHKKWSPPACFVSLLFTVLLLNFTRQKNVVILTFGIYLVSGITWVPVCKAVWVVDSAILRIFFFFFLSNSKVSCLLDTKREIFYLGITSF